MTDGDALDSTADLTDPALAYQVWVGRTMLTSEGFLEERQSSLDLPRKPRISVIMPVYHVPPDILEQAILSVRTQSYPFWQLCIVDDGTAQPEIQALLRAWAERDDRISLARRERNGGIVAASNDALGLATGEFIALLDHDDELAPEALYQVAVTLNAHPDLDMLYSDEDHLTVEGVRRSPFFKPDWSPDYLRSTMYTCHLTVYRRSVVEAVGGFRNGYDGSQDYDLALRVCEKTKRIFHVPRVLYHWRQLPGSAASSTAAKPYAYTAARLALEDHLCRTGQAGQVEALDYPGVFRMQYALDDRPLVSIVIVDSGSPEAASRAGPTNHLRACLKDLTQSTAYEPYEVVVVGSSGHMSEIDDELHGPGGRSVIAVEVTEASTVRACWAAGIARAHGDYVVLLSSRVSAHEPTWLTAMLELGQLPGVSAVGPKLVGPDGRIRHAGLVIPDGFPRGASSGLPDEGAGYGFSLTSITNYAAVSSACLLTKRRLWDRLGDSLGQVPDRYLAVEYCLRGVEAGYRSVFTPFARLELAGELPEDSDVVADVAPEDLAAFRRWWSEAGRVDSWYSPHFSPASAQYRLNWRS